MPNFKPNWTFTDSHDQNGWMFAECLPKGIDTEIICSTTIDIRFDAEFCTHSRNMTVSHDRIGWMFAERYYGRKILFRLVWVLNKTFINFLRFKDQTIYFTYSYIKKEYTWNISQKYLINEIAMMYILVLLK